MTISRRILLGLRWGLEKNGCKNQNALYITCIFLSKIRAIYARETNNTEKLDRS